MFARLTHNLLKAKFKKEAIPDVEIVADYCEKGFEQLTKPKKMVKAFLGQIRQQSKISKFQISISKNELNDQFNEGKTNIKAIHKKSKTTKSKEGLTNKKITSNTDIYKDFDNYPFDIYVDDDDLVIQKLMSNVGDDFSHLNENNYIPDFKQMLGLMMPIDNDKDKNKKIPKIKLDRKSIHKSKV
jgi:hypothetical protein